MSELLNIGDLAPDFLLPTDTMGDISLNDFKGKKLVLFFYPKDNTPGCTTEAVEFTQALNAFKAKNCVVIGISADSVKKHENFREKHTLGVVLAADTEHSALNAYGVWQLKKNYGKEYMGIVRSTYLIDESHKIVSIWTKVRVKDHVKNVIDKLNSLD